MLRQFAHAGLTINPEPEKIIHDAGHLTSVSEIRSFSVLSHIVLNSFQVSATLPTHQESSPRKMHLSVERITQPSVSKSQTDANH